MKIDSKNGSARGICAIQTREKGNTAAISNLTASAVANKQTTSNMMDIENDRRTVGKYTARIGE